MIDLSQIEFAYPQGEFRLQVEKLTIPDSGRAAVIGPSGSGKTTLLNLVAGILIGPVLGLVGTETQEIRHFAEFGVVLMLFLIGLELEPRLLWEMRTRLLGLGGLQLGVTAALICVGALLLGVDWRIAVAIGLIFSPP